MEKFKVALCQMDVVNDKSENIKVAVRNIKQASSLGANLVVLPEMFNCPYDNSFFREYAEEISDSKTINSIKIAAVENNVYVAAGSIPEKCSGKIYNTSIFIDNNGKIIGKHRKIHLFDINIPNKISFMESKVLSAGKRVSVIETEFCKIGVGICYDIRFPELMKIMALQNAKLIIVPGAFNMATGPVHWENLIKVRAIDNQVFFAGCSPARNVNSYYTAYGHSMISNPWGEIIGRCSEKAEILIVDIDMKDVDRVRENLPVLKHMRNDVYEIYIKE